MSVVQIPNLGAAIALNGTEQLEGVQAGTSVKLTVAQLGAYITAQYPPPGVSSVATSAPITGGTITTTGTIGLAGAGVTNAYLATMSAGTVKANVTGGSAQPTDATPSGVLDIIGSTRGSILYRGAADWSALPPGTAGYVLGTGGTGTDPVWVLASGAATNMVIGVSPVTGGTNSYLLYDNGGVLGNLSVVPPTNGGTGINNGAYTITLSGSIIAGNAFSQIVLGAGAMPVLGAGNQYSIAIGTEALRDATGMDATVAIGYHAGAAATTGRAGTFIGHVAGEFIGTGSSNTAIGGYAMRGLVSDPISGVDNTFVGEAAGINLRGSGPNYNTGVGFNVLFGLQGGDSNTAVGLGAGLSLVTTSGNTLMGLNVYGWGAGSNNVVIGYSAGKGTNFIVNTAGGTTSLGGTTLYFADTTGMATGTVLYAGGALVVGTKIVSVTVNTSVVIDTPTFNSVAPGTQVTVLANQHTGARNVYIGYFSGNSIQGAIDDITAVGYGSLRFATTGLRNTAIGAYASENQTTSNDNTTLGYRAGRYVTSDDNTFLGASAGRSVTGNRLTGTNNTGVGSDALADIQGAAASNTAVGNAAALNITTGSSNTFVGANIAATLTTGSKNIIIGPSLNVAAAGTSNTLNIGAAIFGTGILGGTVKIGIGTNAPAAVLEIVGDLRTSVPSGAAAASWKLGSLVTGAVVADATRSIYVDIGGVVYKLIVAT